MAAKKSAAKKGAARKPAAKAAPKAAAKAAPDAVPKAAPKSAPKSEPKSEPKAAAKKAPTRKSPAKKKRPAAPAASDAAPAAVARAAAPPPPPPVEDEAEERAEGGPGLEEPVLAPARLALPPLPRLPARRADGTITVALANGSHYAFMLCGLALGRINMEDRRYEVVRRDIDALDEEARRGTHDLISLSFPAYPAVRASYILSVAGSSFADHRGPMVVSRRPIRWSEVEEEGLRVAVPSRHSAANLLLRLWLPKADLELVPMSPRQVVLMVRADRIRAGVLVDEELLTYRNFNLVGVQDLGQWWFERTEGLPAPLTALAMRRDIDEELRGKIQLDVKRSIAYALGHRQEALEWAQDQAPRHDTKTLDDLAKLFVNEMSLSAGERGRQSLRLFFQRASEHGLLPAAVEPVFQGDTVDEE
jgi:1,4-dihydroxy-6-naphthoate synthase